MKTETLLEQARAYYGASRYDVARRLLEQARSQDPVALVGRLRKLESEFRVVSGTVA